MIKAIFIKIVTLFIMVSIFATSSFAAISFHLTLPIKKQTTMETVLLDSPSDSGSILQNLDKGTGVNAQDLVITDNNELWWEIKLYEGNKGYVRAIETLTYVPKCNLANCETNPIIKSEFLMNQAKLELAEFLITNEEITKQYNVAQGLISELVLQENPTAIWLYANMMRDGHISGKKPFEAMFLFVKAINSGEGRAHFDFSKMFFYGIGTEVNKHEALYHARKGAEFGDSRAKDWLVEHDKELKQLLFQDVKSKFDYEYNRAVGGNIESIKYVASCHLNGLGVQQNVYAAINWFERAANENDTDAMLALGEIYMLDSTQQVQDMTKAMEWFYKAAQLGSPKAQYIYGNAIYYGMGIPKNHGQGKYWLNKAMEADYPLAKTTLEQIKEFE